MLEIDYFSEKNTLDAKRFIKSGCSKEALLKKFNHIQVKDIANFLGLKGISKKKKAILWEEMYELVKNYGDSPQIIYVGRSNETNKFPFNVHYRGIWYRAVFKDEYMQVIERLYQNPNLDYIQFAEDDVIEDICMLVENWFHTNENQAYWIQEKEIG